MRLSKTFFAAILAVSCVSSALAQTTVGQLLDSGAVKLSAADFKQEIVGRFLVGPSTSGGLSNQSSTQEVGYLEGGVIRGSGFMVVGTFGQGTSYPIEGTWTIDELNRVCQTLRAGNLVLAPRCQYWFKQSDKYFFADSDSDRSAHVTVRTVKKM